MAKCKYIKCDSDVTGRQVYCSDKCRKAQSRTDNSDKPELGHKLGQANIRPGLQATEVQYLAQQSIPNYGQSDCQCRHCRTNRTNGGKHIINHGSYKTASQLAERELNRVSLPGDPDYTGVCIGSKYDGHRGQ